MSQDQSNLFEPPNKPKTEVWQNAELAGVIEHLTLRAQFTGIDQPFVSVHAK